MTEKEDLVQKKCVPCSKGALPLTGPEIATLTPSLDKDWRVVNLHHLEREFHFPDFKQALERTVAIGQLAEREGHHPDILLSWGKVKVTIWTHKINGLSVNDFILAAKIDTI